MLLFTVFNKIVFNDELVSISIGVEVEGIDGCAGGIKLIPVVLALTSGVFAVIPEFVSLLESHVLFVEEISMTSGGSAEFDSDLTLKHSPTLKGSKSSELSVSELELSIKT